MRRRMAMARKPDDPDSARFRALKLLERRAQSVGEMRRKLRDRGFTSEAIKTVVTRMLETGLLNDERFARDMAFLKAAIRPQGRRMVVAKLMAHGISRELASAATEEALAGKDEAELAEEAARKWAKRYRGKPLDERGRKRLEGFLVRQGFGWNSVSKAMRKIGAEEPGED